MIVDWKPAQGAVNDVFFHDVVNVYTREDAGKNDWGEVQQGYIPVALNVACNIEIVSQTSNAAQTGMTQEKVLRISVAKDAFVPSMDAQYLVQIVKARVAVDTTKPYWRVESVQEGQISIVITCKLGPTL
jgi:hypothetical protein